MVKYRLLIVVLCILPILSGCALFGKKFNKADIIKHMDKNMATVYLYRPFAMYGIVGSPDIFINDKEMGSLDNDSYVILKLQPGEHIFSVKWNFFSRPFGTHDDEAIFSFKKGSLYFIKYSVHDYKSSFTGSPIVPIIASGSFDFSEMDKRTALNEISDTVEKKWD